MTGLAVCAGDRRSLSPTIDLRIVWPRQTEMKEGLHLSEAKITLGSLIVPFVVAALFFSAAGTNYARVPLAQKEADARRKKARQVFYVCPMHAEVRSKSPGTCHRCNMRLVKRRSAKSTVALSDYLHKGSKIEEKQLFLGQTQKARQPSRPQRDRIE